MSLGLSYPICKMGKNVYLLTLTYVKCFHVNSWQASLHDKLVLNMNWRKLQFPVPGFYQWQFLLIVRNTMVYFIIFRYFQGFLISFFFFTIIVLFFLELSRCSENYGSFLISTHSQSFLFLSTYWTVFTSFLFLLHFIIKVLLRYINSI